MKPYIIPEISPSGKKQLVLQCEGVAASDISNIIQGHSVVECIMPAGHSFQSAWIFQIVLDNDDVLEFTSACTEIVDWQEVGSLNIRFISHSFIDRIDHSIDMLKSNISDFGLVDVQKLVYEDSDVVTECGLILLSSKGEQIIIAAGISPGSVSVLAPFTNASFEPQFSLEQCRTCKME